MASAAGSTGETLSDAASIQIYQWLGHKAEAYRIVGDGS